MIESAVTAADVARVGDRPVWADIVPAPGGEEVWWDEPRPAEGGRRCVVRRTPDGEVHDVLPPGWNARNRVIEYGGRSWRALPDGGLVFTNWADQRLYHLDRLDPGTQPQPISPPGPSRYADLILHGDEVWCVRETGVRRDLVAVPLTGGEPRVVATAQHFLMNPRVSPDGRQVAWIGWDHPNMPWDGTELCVAPLREDGTAGPYRVVAGGPEESVAQAEWRDDGALYAVTDATGWWNIHLVPVDGGPAENLTPIPEEFGDAAWKLGSRWFALAGDRIAAVHGTAGVKRLSVLDPATGALTDVGGEYSWWAATLSASPDGRRVVGVATTTHRPFEVVRVDLDTGAHEVLSPAKELPDPALLPTPEAMVFDGVHAVVYPPRGAREGVPSPYVMFVHGGPTGSSPLVFDLSIAYFTSRGIGVAEVNYGGSTGYGRAYRERLRHNWGVVDVRDSETVARGLAAAGLADPERLAIRGGSAGGWTAVAALVHSDAFRGCVAHYAITDPEGWARETHDFESRYLDGLIGPLPETRQRYLDRCPTLHAHQASGPALLLHGLEDAIVDPGQAERFVAALDAHGGRWAYLTFPGEQHGWRREETIVAALEAELAFYGLIFGLPTPEVPPLTLKGPK
ncbi:acyl-peptide hydrolase [Sphaerisporangium krabiense]|uniref:Dipeptidyl aminopeptidase/acylaminoacyl peptidase n=1 Tax=Sphaerisporangium krabiense TaxID=763782 RepID=A0A7W8Z8T4_9ACTN|nr:prolyl oligopeptidase family serine peptidase [Sphaerisporangium krabiense]MBB5629607.1 dipeptidyl aminopeptidase/acylaminoacyl peptidase [Sphaerisporangium krabiense]GII67266.1 acyl-peptide hydrolase [Sphaerisporangium krabiense]